MAKKKEPAKTAENQGNEALTPEAMRPQESETPLEAPENAGEDMGLVTYRVTAPRGIYLREGPGRAYRPLTVLPGGAEVLGMDVTGMLWADRKPGDTAWIKVLSKDMGPSLPAEPAATGPTAQALSGWVDSAFLERVC